MKTPPQNRPASRPRIHFDSVVVVVISLAEAKRRHCSVSIAQPCATFWPYQIQLSTVVHIVMIRFACNCLFFLIFCSFFPLSGMEQMACGVGDGTARTTCTHRGKHFSIVFFCGFFKLDWQLTCFLSFDCVVIKFENAINWAVHFCGHFLRCFLSDETQMHW